MTAHVELLDTTSMTVTELVAHLVADSGRIVTVGPDTKSTRRAGAWLATLTTDDRGAGGRVEKVNVPLDSVEEAVNQAARIFGLDPDVFVVVTRPDGQDVAVGPYSTPPVLSVVG